MNLTQTKSPQFTMAQTPLGVDIDTEVARGLVRDRLTKQDIALMSAGLPGGNTWDIIGQHAITGGTYVFMFSTAAGPVAADTEKLNGSIKEVWRRAFDGTILEKLEFELAAPTGIMCALAANAMRAGIDMAESHGAAPDPMQMLARALGGR